MRQQHLPYQAVTRTPRYHPDFSWLTPFFRLLAMSVALAVSVVDIAGRILCSMAAELGWAKADICSRIPGLHSKPWGDVRLFIGQVELVGNMTLRHFNVATKVTIQLVMDARSDGVVSVLGRDGRLQLLRVRDESVVTMIPERLTDVREVSFCPSGRMLMTLALDGVCRVWWAISGGLCGEFKQKREYVNSATWSFNGELLVTCCSDGQARVWATATALPVREVFSMPAPGRNSAVFAPRNMRMLTSQGDGRTRIWSDGGSRESLTLSGHGVWSRSTPAGDSVVTWSTAGVATVWRSTTGDRVFDFMVTANDPCTLR